MATNHRISSDVHGRYQGAVKAKELRSQKHEHSNTHAGLREEGAKPRLKLYDGFDKGFKLINDNGRSHQPRDKVDGNGHRHGERDRFDHYDRKPNFDRRHFDGHVTHPQGIKLLGHGNLRIIHGDFHEKLQPLQITKITITHSSMFSGSHLGSFEKTNEAYQDFLKSALSFIQNPNKQAYKALNDSMIKLMDPRFAPAVKGGAAQVSIRNVNGTTMAKITMEVTPAPTKTLEEAREDLKKAYSIKRDGEKDIAGIREEAYANYIRALSEKFKNDGKISHTNNTPTTPVFKSSVIYIVKVTQINLSSLHELKKPDFKHNFKGKLHMKGHHGFWNGYRPSHKSYVDMIKHDSKKSHIDRDFKSGKNIEAKNHNRHSGENRAENAGHNHHNKARTHRI